VVWEPGGRNLLESALAQPRQTLFGNDAYPSLIDKAAALLRSLMLNHPFVEGNKRFAVAATDQFLGMNGFETDFSVDQWTDFVLWIASSSPQPSWEEIRDWLAPHVRPIMIPGEQSSVEESMFLASTFACILRSLAPAHSLSLPPQPLTSRG